MEDNSKAEWSHKLSQAQATTTKAAKAELSGRFDEAFKLNIEAAQTYLYLVRNATNDQTKAQLRAISAKVLERAERIKTAKRDQIKPVGLSRLSSEEQDRVIHAGTQLGGIHLPIWKPSDGKQNFLDNAALASPPPLSSTQQAELDKWVPAAAAFPHAPLYADGSGGREITQDNVADCSVVTALIVAAEHHRKFRSRLGLSCLYPQDATGAPVASPSGRYSARLHLNGAWRRVVLDDRLPLARNGRPMCATTTARDQLWPALIEKAYLAVKGGYEFGGSNSAVDLHALSGWIPESVSLRGDRFRSGKSWGRIHQAFRNGECVVTVGTGKAVGEDLSGELVPSHSYAVVEMREIDGHRKVEIVNPWPTLDRQQDHSGQWTADLRNALPAQDRPPLVIDWDAISSHFDTLHLNWDPDRFAHADTIHCALDGQPDPLANGNAKATQLQLVFEPPPVVGQEVWVLLSRHERGAEEKDRFVGLRVAARWSTEVDTVGTTRVDDGSSLTDNPHLLYRFEAQPGVGSYDVFVTHRGSAASTGITLRAMSSTPLRIVDGPQPLPYATTLKGAWTALTAGGNHTCSSFLHNPQFRVALAPLPGRPAARAELIVECETATDLPVNVRIVRRNGDRVDSFDERDVLAGSSKYAYGRDACAARDVEPDVFTLVVSAFAPEQMGEFEVTVRSSLPLEVGPIPTEGAGMYSRRAKGAWSAGLDGGSGDVLANPRFLLTLIQPTSLRIRMQASSSRPVPIALAVYATDAVGATKEVVHSTGAYSDAPTGVVTGLFRLTPSPTGYIVIPSTYHPTIHAPFTLVAHADQPFTLAALT